MSSHKNKNSRLAARNRLRMICDYSRPLYISAWLIWRGWRHPITENDLWNLPPNLMSQVTVPPFDAQWQLEINKLNSKTEPSNPAEKEVLQEMKKLETDLDSHPGVKTRNRKTEPADTSEKEVLLELKKLRGVGAATDLDTHPGVKTRNKKTEPADSTEEVLLELKKPATTDSSPDSGVETRGKKTSSWTGHANKWTLIKVLFRTYGSELLVSHLLRFCADLVQFLFPLLLKRLIWYVEHRKSETDWKGYVIVASFFIVSMFKSILLSQCVFVAFNIGLKIKTALVTAVYRKALSMNNESRRQYTTGAIVNMMSVDCARVREVTSNLWVLWSAPFMLSLGLYFLYQTIGVAIFAGIAVMLVLAPVNFKLSTYLRKLHNKRLTVKDERLKFMNEVLTGIKVLKLYAWEDSFRDRIAAIRSKEVRILQKLAILNSVNTFCFTGAPTLVTLISFVTYVMLSDDHYLDSQTAFVSLSLFTLIRQPMNSLPNCVSMVVQAFVSIKRLSNYMTGEDLDSDSVTSDTETGMALSIRNGSFTWNRSLQVPTLNNINVDVRRGQLIAVVGPVGAGKSSLLLALLGEMEKLTGCVQMKGSVAYVPQQAWIQHMTLRGNLLFGRRYKEKQYWNVIRACALESDLDLLPGGDDTEIGEKGVNLSGGQKQRVSLARAVYSNKDIYLLDDPLSAVDSHVGKHIFSHVIGHQGLLKNTTRILVTHGVHWLPMVDVIVVMDKGEVTEVGSYEELLDHDGPFAQFLKTYLLQETDGESDVELDQIKTGMLERVESLTSIPQLTPLSKSPVRLTSGLSQSVRSINKDNSLSGSLSHYEDKANEERGESEDRGTEDEDTDSSDIDEDPRSAEKHRLVEDEKSEQGRVQCSVIRTYFRALGVTGGLIIIVCFLLFRATGVFSNVWLSIWTDEPRLKNLTFWANTSDVTYLSYYYLSVYSAATFSQAVLIFFFVGATFTQMVRAAATLHQNLLDNILRQPMAFFETTPTGRIMNRFTRDVGTIDTQMARILRQWLNNVSKLITIIVIISYSTPLFLTVVVPILVLYGVIQRMYIPTSRQLRRNDSTSRSPIFQHFSETISGASSIRAYGMGERFIGQFLRRVDKNNVFHYAAVSANRWLKLRLEFLGNVVILSAVFFAVVTPGISGGMVGLSVMYAVQVTAALNMLVQVTTQLETNIVSVERIVEYSSLPTEGAWIVADHRPPPEWPEEGEVELNNLQVRYRPELEMVLQGISARFAPSEKVGVVGRTGAGKSSLTLALFRILDAEGGSISIDGLDIADIGLHDLRSRLTILPQEPVLFSGSLRMNLDPSDAHSDDEVWQALEQAHLKEYVTSLAAGLQHECEEGGQNLSVGQRQLVCLARSLLRRTKVLILDEATAAVDMETDDLIQSTIRTAFSDCTVITIAHRLNTILDYDRILVLSAGQILEFDSPDKLLQDKKSVFYNLARDAGIVS
ncbi:multidrug resistance-associated protein 1-like [Haliotis asinina]|uniref:multidrug resistance-associated protein 1-like n=1 Tax=Haliotis asinina TaxID=109174 RepID=UPI00353211CE